MSEDQNEVVTVESDEAPVIDELSMLKQRAKMMGITFSNNISIETLKQKIEEKKAGNTTAEMDKLPDTVAPPALVDPALPPETKVQTLRQKITSENMRLIRVRITNMDPKKKDLPGEILTVANEYLGTVRRYVPYGEVTEDGYHIPYCIYKALKARKFLNLRTFKDRKNQNQIRVEQSWAQEFAIEVLEPLTKEELKQLATTQAAAGGLN